MFLARVYNSNDLNNSFDTALTPGVCESNYLVELIILFVDKTYLQ